MQFKVYSLIKGYWSLWVSCFVRGISAFRGMKGLVLNVGNMDV